MAGIRPQRRAIPRPIMQILITSTNSPTSVSEQSLAKGLCNISKPQKFALARLLRPDSGRTLDRFNEQAYAEFVEYFDQTVLLLRRHHQGFAAETIKGTVDLIRSLRDSSSRPLLIIVQDLSARFLNVDQHAIQRSLELSVRI